MAILNRLTTRHRLTLIGTTCAALCIATTAVTAQALASGTAPTPPKITGTPTMTTHPVSPTGQALPAANATNAVCGQVITASLTLNGNLFCSGDGLTVTGTSVVLNLNGFTIFGPGSSSSAVGVRVLGKSATVENGQLIYFNAGVVDGGTSDTLTKLRASQNFFGIEEYGVTNKLTSNEVFANQGDGIYAVGTGVTLTGNRATSNSLASYYANIYLGGTKSVATGNFANGAVSYGYGLFDVGWQTTLTNNVASFNQQDGIVSYDGGLNDGGGNTAKGNDILAGDAPQQCQNVVCN